MNKIKITMVSASWCASCKGFYKTFEELKSKHEDIDFEKIVLDDCMELAEKLKIQTLPTFIFTKDGEEFARTTGAKKEEITYIILRTK